ncbi:MAG: GAF domain-containing sensor histidine kinase [Chloroflexota bacterium]
MSKRLLRWLTVFIPVGFVFALMFLEKNLWHDRYIWLNYLVILIFLLIGTLLFSNWVFQLIDQRESEIHRRASQLEALNLASLALITELDLGLVLQKVVDLSRELVSSRYGALGVLSQEGARFEQFVTSGITEEERKLIGRPPEGLGIFKLLIERGESMIVDNVPNYHAHAGFPENHPVMRSLLGVPIKTKGKVIGDLYLVEKIDPYNQDSSEVIPFNEEDKHILEMFATQAAIAIENARLYRQVQQLAILEERQRFGMDLHDGVIQSIYAVGLMLEDIQRRIDSEPDGAKDGIFIAIRSLNTAISDIRNYILDLRPQHFQGRDIVQGMEELSRALRANTFMTVSMDVKNIDSSDLTPEQTVEILHIAQEALSNVQKHAKASEVNIVLNIEGRDLQLEIMDNGVSIVPKDLQRSRGNGLRNMQDRAASLNGDIRVIPQPEGGTVVRLVVPMP